MSGVQAHGLALSESGISRVQSNPVNPQRLVARVLCCELVLEIFQPVELVAGC